jgi:hypothetical protein
MAELETKLKAYLRNPVSDLDLSNLSFGTKGAEKVAALIKSR